MQSYAQRPSGSGHRFLPSLKHFLKFCHGPQNAQDNSAYGSVDKNWGTRVGNQSPSLKCLLMCGGLLGRRVNSREASNSGETMRVPIFESGCYSEDPASWTRANDYSEELWLDQEYQIIAQMNGDYACLLNTVSPDHELLTTEGKSVC